MQDFDTFFRAKQPLFVLSSNRAKNEFYKYFAINNEFYMSLESSTDSIESTMQKYFKIFDFYDFKNKETNLDSINFNIFLPPSCSIGEMFERIVFSEMPLVPKDARHFLMIDALKEIKNNYKKTSKLSFLSFEDNFISFLETSNILLSFYDELRNHKIPINTQSLQAFCDSDIYEIHFHELEILSQIYLKYLEKIRYFNLNDSIFSDEFAKNYKIDSSFLQSVSSVHIELEGFISPLQYEILQNAATFVPIFLHFKIDKYNLENFKILNKEIEINKKYIFCVHNNEIFSKNLDKTNQKIKLYKTEKSFNQAYLAIYLAVKWLKEIDSNKASENDFAIILPDEKFIYYLETLDSKNMFNYAMGRSIEGLKEYQILKEIYENYLETKEFSPLNIKILLDFIPQDSIESNLEDSIFQDSIFAELNKNYEITNPSLQTIQKMLVILFKNNEIILNKGIAILGELLFISNKKMLKNITFKDLFISFMRDFSKTTIDSIGGGKIRVMGTLEARALSFKEVLILDFTDDIINVEIDDLFLNSNIRKKFNMPTKKDKENLYKHHYHNIITNTQITHISFVENNEKIPSNMLLEMHLDLRNDLSNAQNIDEKYCYYDITKGRDLRQKDEEFDTFQSFINNFTFSASKLQDYKDCTRRFYFKYVERLEVENTQDSMNIGTKIHQILQKVYQPYLEKTLVENDIKEIRKNFKNEQNVYREKNMRFIESNKKNNIESSEFMDIESLLTFDNLCDKISTEYFNKEMERIKKQEITLLALELSFYGTKDSKNNIRYKGKIDRIEKIGNKILIADYKTTSIKDIISTNKKKEIDTSNIRLQMPFYNMMSEYIGELNEFKEMEKLMAYIDLKETKSLKIIDKEIIEIGKQEIDEIFRTFGTKNEMTQNLDKCRYCGYKSICGRD